MTFPRNSEIVYLMSNPTPTNAKLTALTVAMSALEDSWDSTDWSSATGDRIYDVVVAAMDVGKGITLTHKSIKVKCGYLRFSRLKRPSEVTVNFEGLIARDGKTFWNGEDAYKRLKERLPALRPTFVGVDCARELVLGF